MMEALLKPRGPRAPLVWAAALAAVVCLGAPRVAYGAQALGNRQAGREDVADAASKHQQLKVARSRAAASSSGEKAAAAAATKTRAAVAGPKHLLSDQDLSTINSVECLEEVQQNNPGSHGPVDCAHLGVAKPAPVAKENHSGVDRDAGWFIGHYPKYTDPICRGQNGTRFCDPDDLLNKTDVAKVSERLHKFWVENSVHSCPLPGHDRLETYPFNLGIVMMGGFPAMELDDESLDHFGTSVLHDWDMAPQRDCPNGALLIFIRDYQIGFLSALSCEFVCKARPGGQNVMTAMKAQMDVGNTLGAVMDGIAMFEEVFRKIHPESVEHAREKSQEDAVISGDTAENLNSIERTLEEWTGGTVPEGEALTAEDWKKGSQMSHEEYHRMKSIDAYLSRREGTYALLFRFVVIAMLLTCVIGCYCVTHHVISRDVHAAYVEFQKDMDPTYNDPSIIWGNHYADGGRSGYGTV